MFSRHTWWTYHQLSVLLKGKADMSPEEPTLHNPTACTIVDAGDSEPLQEAPVLCYLLDGGGLDSFSFSLETF